MLFKYQYNKQKDCPSIYIDLRQFSDEKDWQDLRDVIGAFKLSLDCNCHVELQPVKDHIQGLHKLHKNKPIIKIDIQLETWKARCTKLSSLIDCINKE